MEVSKPKNTSEFSKYSITNKQTRYSLIKKKRNSLLGIFIAITIFVITQLAITYYVSLETVYNHRINYNMFLEDNRTIEVVMDEMAKTIKKDSLTDYAILIGDSVSWGTNESSEHSLGRYLNELAVNSKEKPLQRVFNLSAPSMFAGDAYTILLMLEEKGIKTDNVIIGLSYSAFVKPDPGPRQVFWLGNQLRSVDSVSYSTVLPQLLQNHYEHKSGWDYIEEKVIENTFYSLPIIKYKDALAAYWEQQYLGTDLLGDPRQWSEKSFSEEWLNDSQYLRFFDPTLFEMNESNWGVYFMDRIIEKMEDKQLLVFVSGGNSELSKTEVEHPGYIENLTQMEAYFLSKEVPHILLQGLLDDSLFTDHVHFTKEGNELLANLIWISWIGREV